VDRFASRDVSADYRDRCRYRVSRDGVATREGGGGGSGGGREGLRRTLSDEPPSGSLHERGRHGGSSRSHDRGGGIASRSTDQRHFTERRKKTVRFDPGEITRSNSISAPSSAQSSAVSGTGGRRRTREGSGDRSSGSASARRHSTQDGKDGGGASDGRGCPCGLEGSGVDSEETWWKSGGGGGGRYGSGGRGGDGWRGGSGSRWGSDRQGSQDSQTKDSGIDTSSTFTSSEDSNRGESLKVPTSTYGEQEKSLKNV
jgi:hypothetical protein